MIDKVKQSRIIDYRWRVPRRKDRETESGGPIGRSPNGFGEYQSTREWWIHPEASSGENEQRECVCTFDATTFRELR